MCASAPEPFLSNETPPSSLGCRRFVWLLRVNDTAQHREWLQTAVDGFLTRQHCEGTWCAFKEELSHSGWGESRRLDPLDDCMTMDCWQSAVDLSHHDCSPGN